MIDASEWQKYLLINSDIIYQWVGWNPLTASNPTGERALRTDAPQYSSLYPILAPWVGTVNGGVDITGPFGSTTSDGIPGAVIDRYLLWQNAMYSNSLMPSGRVANILFGSRNPYEYWEKIENAEKDYETLIHSLKSSLDAAYSTNFSFVVFHQDRGTATDGGSTRNGRKRAFEMPINGPRSFNRKTIPLSNLTKDGSPIIKSIQIINETKDAINLGAQYTVIIEIKFSLLESLLRTEVPKIDIWENDKEFGTIRFMEILYRKFGLAKNDSAATALLDGDGLGLLCELRFRDASQFEDANLASKTKRALDFLSQDLNNQQKLFTKLLHLHYVKHELKFDNTSAQIPDNTLVITYTSYETDETVKPFVNGATPNFVFNMYDFLDNPTYNQTLKTTYTGSWTDFQQARETVATEQAKVAELASRLADVRSRIADESLIKQIEENIEARREAIAKFSFDISNFLISTIVNSCHIYEIKIPTKDLGITGQSNTANRFFSWSTLGVIASDIGYASATGATIGLIGGPAGVVVGGKIGFWAGLAVGVTHAAVLVWNSVKLTYETLETKETRKRLLDHLTKNPQKAAIWYVGDNKFNESVPTFPSTTMTVIPGKAATTPGKEERSKEKAMEEASKALDKQQTSEQELKEATVQKRFIFFRDILKFLTYGNNNDTEVITLNHFPLVDPRTIKYSAINYAYLPITLENFLAFLKRNILDRNDLNFSSDLFVKLAYKELIFDLLSQGKTNSTTIRNVAPVTLRTGMAIHTDELDLNSYLTWDPNTGVHGDLNILGDWNKHSTFLKHLLATQNITKRTSGAKKLIVFGSIPKIENTDFYKKYAEWCRDSSAKGSQLNKTKFTKPIDYTDITIIGGKRVPITKQYLPNFDLTEWYEHEFEYFINTRYRMPCIQPYSHTFKYRTIVKDYAFNLSRLDNVNLDTANRINGETVFRQFYKINGAKLWSYLWWFLDKGANIFVAPPTLMAIGARETDSINPFGYAGVYAINEASATFKLAPDPGSTFMPNINDHFEISANQISTGEIIIHPKPATSSPGPIRSTYDLPEDILTLIPEGDRIPIQQRDVGRASSAPVIDPEAARRFRAGMRGESADETNDTPTGTEP